MSQVSPRPKKYTNHIDKCLPCLPKKARKHCKVTLDQMAPFASLEWILNLFHNVYNYTFIIMKTRDSKTSKGMPQDSNLITRKPVSHGIMKKKKFKHCLSNTEKLTSFQIEQPPVPTLDLNPNY